MGVYIKGMKMPQGESCVTVRIWGDGRVIGVHNDSLVKHATELPPHGWLIDADALADVFRGFIAMYDSCPFSQLSLTDKARRDELQSALAEVLNAPTIIPAEEAKE